MGKNISVIHRWLILINVTISVFMATLDISIVNIALPTISKVLKVDISSVQWVVTSYLLTISLILLIWGKLADIYGKKKIFTMGFFIFTVGSTLCSMSTNLNMLVISRIIQAIGASATMALGQGIITEIFPATKRGKALGIVGTTVALGSLTGPSLGGILVYTFNWQSIFFINIPIGILGIIFTLIVFPEMPGSIKNKIFDIKGSILFILSVLFLILGLLFVQDGIVKMDIFILMVIISLVLMIIFIKVEINIVNPLVNISLFKIKEFSFGLSAGFMSFLAISSTLLFVPFFLQIGLNMDTMKAGLIMSFYPLSSAFVAPISGWISDKITFRPPTVIGMSISTIILFIMSTLTDKTPYIYFAVLMVLLGIGNATFQSPNTSSIMGSVPREKLGVASGINALFRNLGMVSGAAISVLIFSFVSQMNINSLSDSEILSDIQLFLKGYKVIMLFGSFSCLMAVLLSITRIFKKIFTNEKTSTTLL